MEQKQTSVAVFALEQALSSVSQLPDPDSALLIYKALYKLGVVLQQSEQVERAIEQYRKCWDALVESGSSSAEVELLREECLRNLAACHLSRGKPQDLLDAAKIVNSAAGEGWSNALWLLMLEVDLALKRSTDTKSTLKLLQTAIKLMEMTPEAVESILQRCRNLSENDVPAALDCLSTLYTRIKSNDKGSIELYLIHLIWFSTRCSIDDETTTVKRLHSSLDGLKELQSEPLEWQTRQAGQLVRCSTHDPIYQTNVIHSCSGVSPTLDCKVNNGSAHLAGVTSRTTLCSPRVIDPTRPRSCAGLRSATCGSAELSWRWTLCRSSEVNRLR